MCGARISRQPRYRCMACCRCKPSTCPLSTWAFLWCWEATRYTVSSASSLATCKPSPLSSLKCSIHLIGMLQEAMLSRTLTALLSQPHAPNTCHFPYSSRCHNVDATPGVLMYLVCGLNTVVEAINGTMLDR